MEILRGEDFDKETEDFDFFILELGKMSEFDSKLFDELSSQIGSPQERLIYLKFIVFNNGLMYIFPQRIKHIRALDLIVQISGFRGLDGRPLCAGDIKLVKEEKNLKRFVYGYSADFDSRGILDMQDSLDFLARNLKNMLGDYFNFQD